MPTCIEQSGEFNIQSARLNNQNGRLNIEYAISNIESGSLNIENGSFIFDNSGFLNSSLIKKRAASGEKANDMFMVAILFYNTTIYYNQFGGIK